jgi:signal transduction histidine kinase
MALLLNSAPIADVVKTIEPLAAKNANQVAVNCDGAIGTLHADQMRLRQAMLNLMSNANKFTERGRSMRGKDRKMGATTLPSQSLIRALA